MAQLHAYITFASEYVIIIRTIFKIQFHGRIRPGHYPMMPGMKFKLVNTANCEASFVT